MEAVVVWVPFILVIGCILVFGISSRRAYQKQVDDVMAINDELVAINRAMAAELVEIKDILKDRK